jgi:insertion element IS1 protein InsB
MICPSCNSQNTRKNGTIHNGKKKFICRDCGRQFVENPSNKIISKETRNLVDRLLLERLSLAAICRVVEVSERWLQYYVNEKYKNIERKVSVSSKKKGKLTLECDEMRCLEPVERWSFVSKKKSGFGSLGTY